MADIRKRVLVAGLGRFVAAEYEAGSKLGVQKSNKQTMVEDIEKAKAAGYDCSGLDVNPDQAEATIQQIKEILQGQHYDLFVIGFGLRSNPTLTPLFEDVVNACVEVSPKTKFGFNPLPNELYSTILRLLPKKLA
ncbi:hypothetical protein C7974DRAFT_416598 [Boeremia exigua]|uniref:uncharacterized protein n=1 Tax=Boeremia exigua TaxID=749465 RepID=UPI001E8EAF70|nr:uncharacterized protein C7974DRAFT_416598 [Boeremia exigua]KAH6616468.1 hypothetical protein C7974DRAFT_416598 [Boeremia exigua]